MTPVYLHMMQAAVIACYVVFALQIVVQTRWRRLKPRPAIAVGSLIAVFLLCAVAGYLSHLLGWSVAWQTLIHWGLATAAVALVVFNLARDIAETISDGDGGDGRR